MRALFCMGLAVRSIRAVLVVIASSLIFSGCNADEPQARIDPASALNDFYAYDGAEDTLMDPLIVAGKEVVPLVLEDVVEHDMVKRRYAIQALGNIGDPAAIQTLKSLAQSDGEPGYIRCVSTQAVAQISWDEGRLLAEQYVDATQPGIPDCLPRVSSQILRFGREEWLQKTGIVRSLEDARNRRHY